MPGSDTTKPPSKPSEAPLLRRVWWYLFRVGGAPKVTWDSQYALGIWQADHRPRSQVLLKLVTSRCAGRRLVEFGCGEGSLPRQLPEGTFSTYLGLDISEVAISRARAAVAVLPLAERCEFRVQDLARWDGDRNVGVIVAEECLNYLRPRKLRRLLGKCSECLNDDGRMIAVFHSEAKHIAAITVIRQSMKVLEEQRDGGRLFIVMSRHLSGRH